MNSVILQFHHSAWVISYMYTRRAKTYLATTLSLYSNNRARPAGRARPNPAVRLGPA